MDTIPFLLEQTYAQLGFELTLPAAASAIPKPELVFWNSALAGELGWPDESAGLAEKAAWFSGQALLPGSHPAAMAYAGHQFGHFTLLGDGRALWLGERLSADGQRYDLHLKGSGPTPFARRGDGKATLSAVLRECLISEALHHLGVPTSRSLAAVSTGETIFRAPPQPGAVLTRVARSHIRVGTFEYAAWYQGPEAVRALLEYAVYRHFPACRDAENMALAFLEAVQDAQVALIADWMRIGFVHGVMNTDNMAISGETLDFGPCAFLDVYDPEAVFSRIDTQGRYAYGNQPAIAQWNLGCLAGTLVPLVHANKEKAIGALQEVLSVFQDRYEKRWQEVLGKKLGWETPADEDRHFSAWFLNWMYRHRLDFTRTFREFSDGNLRTEAQSDPGFADFLAYWQQRVARQAGGETAARQIMKHRNPARIPRNEAVESVLDAAWMRGDFGPFQAAMAKLRSPWDADPGDTTWTHEPARPDPAFRTHCNT